MNEHIQAYIRQPTANSDFIFFSASFSRDGFYMTGMSQPERVTWEQWVTFSRSVLIPFIQENGEEIKIRLVRSDLIPPPAT